MMGRTVRRAIVERPAWTRGPLRVEGPDEDAFTLAVSALETLRERGGDPTPFHRVHLVGPSAPEVASALGEALGEPGLEVRRSSGGAAELYQALATATGSGGAEGPEAVVAVDLAAGPSAPTPTGAGAVAFEVAEGPGWRFGRHGERHHPPERRPDATAWVRTVRQGLTDPTSPRGALVVRARAPPPVLLAFWTRELPTMGVETAPEPDPTLGPAPHLSPAMDLLYAATVPAEGPERVVAVIEPDRTTYVGFRVDGPVPVDGPSPITGPPLPWGGRPGGEGDLLNAVSEGAYVPRPRYLESRPSRWRFVADRCAACGRTTFPARGACRQCGRRDGLTEIPLPRDGGVVEARTTVRPGAQPTEFDPWVGAVGGYDVALVRLTPEVVATLTVTDAPAGTTPAGARVRTRLRRLFPMDGEWRYGRKAIVDPVPAA